MKYSILLLTSDSELPTTVKSMLSSYTVLTCTSEAEAIELCRCQPVSLLLLDSSIAPDVHSVLTTFRNIRPTITGILLSSHINNDVLNRAMDTGFANVIEVPLKKERLQKIIKQVIERVRLADDNTRLNTLLPLYSLGERFLSSTTEEEILDSLIESVADLTNSKHISILLYDEQQACLQIAASRGMDVELAKSVHIKPGEDIAGWVFQHGKPVVLNKTDQEKSIFAPFLKRPNIVSAISSPLVIKSKILGVLNISHTVIDDSFSEPDKEVMSIICGQAAMALENVRVLKQMQQITRTKTLFEQFVSPEVAELLLEQNNDPLLIGGIQDITILFADIRNFTNLVQKVDLDDLRIFLNDFFNIFSEIIFDQQGTVDKFMGDAVLALFGAPISNPDASCAAIEAAVLMKHHFRELKKKWSSRNNTFNTLDLGVGVTRGNVFLGNVGSQKRFDYTVIGNEVNMAQRLAAESSNSRIYLTKKVHQDVKHIFNTKKLGETALRGMTEKISIFYLRGD